MLVSIFLASLYLHWYNSSIVKAPVTTFSATDLIVFALYPTLQEHNSLMEALCIFFIDGKVKNILLSICLLIPNFIDNFFNIILIIDMLVLLAHAKEIIH